jgi:4-amino-4-deoxy-L-arabinose transferase-like glycosyltransferase
VTEDKPRYCDTADVAGPPEQRTAFRALPFLFVVAVAAVLCFCGLGTRTLWEDEGEAAVLAQRVLSCGIPKALSGNNLVYQGVPNSYDKAYRWTFHPWGQFYVAAAGLAIFGNTTFAARFPFALCGVLTVAMLYVFVWRHWRSSGIAALSAMFLATSVNFILHCRQCRYYGLSALTTLIVVAIFIEVINNPSRRWWIGWGLALAGQFYADFGTLMVMLPGLLLSFWPIRAGKKEIIAAAKSFALAFLLIIPGLMLHWKRLTAAGGGAHSFFETLRVLLVHIYYFDAWFVPLLFAIPACGIFMWRLLRSKGNCVNEQERIVIVCSFVMASGVAGMAWAVPASYLRYIIPQISLAKLLLALIVAGLYYRLRRTALSLWATNLLSAAVVITLMFTGFFSLPMRYLIGAGQRAESRSNPQPEPFAGMKFAGLIYELTNDFVCCNRVALNAVNDLAEAGETVLIDYGDLPLMFYRPDLNIYGLNTLSEMHNVPDMAITYTSIYYRNYYIGKYIEQVHIKHKCRYLSVIISVPEGLCGNIPEPDEHNFATPSRRFSFQVYLRSDHTDRLKKLPQTTEALEARWYRPH